MGTLVGVVIIAILLCFIWGNLVRLFYYLAWSIQCVLKVTVGVFLPLGASYVLFVALCNESIGAYEAAMVAAGIGYCFGASLVALVFRFIQSIFHGYDVTLGDLLDDSVAGSFFLMAGPPVAFIVRLCQIGPAAGLGISVGLFLKGAALCAMITTYGMIQLIIINKTSTRRELFSLDGHPGEVPLFKCNDIDPYTGRFFYDPLPRD